MSLVRKQFHLYLQSDGISSNLPPAADARLLHHHARALTIPFDSVRRQASRRLPIPGRVSSYPLNISDRPQSRFGVNKKIQGEAVLEPVIAYSPLLLHLHARVHPAGRRNSTSAFPSVEWLHASAARRLSCSVSIRSCHASRNCADDDSRAFA